MLSLLSACQCRAAIHSRRLCHFDSFVVTLCRSFVSSIAIRLLVMMSVPFQNMQSAEESQPLTAPNAKCTPISIPFVCCCRYTVSCQKMKLPIWMRRRRRRRCRCYEWHNACRGSCDRNWTSTWFGSTRFRWRKKQKEKHEKCDVVQHAYLVRTEYGHTVASSAELRRRSRQHHCHFFRFLLLVFRFDLSTAPWIGRFSFLRFQLMK